MSVRTATIFTKGNILDIRYDEQALPSGAVVRGFFDDEGYEAVCPPFDNNGEEFNRLVATCRKYIDTGDWPGYQQGEEPK